MNGGDLMLSPEIFTSMLHVFWRERGVRATGQRAKNSQGGCSREDFEILQYLFEKDEKMQPDTVLQESLWGAQELGCCRGAVTEVNRGSCQHLSDQKETECMWKLGLTGRPKKVSRKNRQKKYK